jgi:biotin-(acetyl-CoA carboxylase) ligase
VIPVWTDEPAFAEGWLEGEPRSWRTGPVEHWSAALTGSGVVAGAEAAGWDGWDALVISRRAPRSQVDLLADMHESGTRLPANVICQADTGKGFHGQRDRAWAALEGNLHVSARRPVHLPVGRVGHALTAVPAMAVVDVLRRLPGLEQVGVKWVNDVVLRGAKIAGVIVRTHLDGDRFEGAVFGIGLNVERSPEIAGDAFVRRATSVLEELRGTSARAAPAPLLAALAASLRDRAEQLRREGPEPLVADYRGCSTVVGREGVLYEDRLDGTPGEVLARGRVVGIGPRLELWMEGVGKPLTRGRLSILDDQ